MPRKKKAKKNASGKAEKFFVVDPDGGYDGLTECDNFTEVQETIKGLVADSSAWNSGTPDQDEWNERGVKVYLATEVPVEVIIESTAYVSRSDGAK